MTSQASPPGEISGHEMNQLGQPLGHLVQNWTPPPLPNREPLIGRFCRVEPLDPSLHAESLHRANSLGDPEINWTYLPYGPFGDSDEYRAWMERACCGADPMFFAIVDHASREALGVASYLRIDPEGGSIEVGHINFSSKLQRTPAATEAMFLMMANAFDLGYRRYEWKCDALNAPSRAAAQRLGFTFEGIFRQATVVKGRNRDSAWYSVIDRDWPTLEDDFSRWLGPANFDEQGKQRSRLSAMTAASLENCKLAERS